MARNNANTASKVIPIRRKGIDMSHTNGQSISTSNASGQQITHSNNQHIKVSISSSSDVIGKENLFLYLDGDFR
jgi:hypothetical protein